MWLEANQLTFFSKKISIFFFPQTKGTFIYMFNIYQFSWRYFFFLVHVFRSKCDSYSNRCMWEVFVSVNVYMCVLVLDLPGFIVLRTHNAVTLSLTHSLTNTPQKKKPLKGISNQKTSWKSFRTNEKSNSSIKQLWHKIPIKFNDSDRCWSYTSK